MPTGTPEDPGGPDPSGFCRARPQPAAGRSILIWFGLTWSLELYQQTVARLWRQGQTSRTVIVQHIVTKGTMDERILKALEKKDSSQADLIEAVKADLEGNA